MQKKELPTLLKGDNKNVTLGTNKNDYQHHAFRNEQQTKLVSDYYQVKKTTIKKQRYVLN